MLLLPPQSDFSLLFWMCFDAVYEKNAYANANRNTQYEYIPLILHISVFIVVDNYEALQGIPATVT